MTSCNLPEWLKLRCTTSYRLYSRFDKELYDSELSSVWLWMAIIISASKPQLLNSTPKLLNSSWCVHLEHSPGISLLIDPLKGHGGQQPTQWWMEVHVALRKDFCSPGPHTLVPCMEKLRWGWGGWGWRWGEKGGWTFPKSSLSFSLSPSQTLWKSTYNWCK